jgi:hypothetical protein
MSASTDGVPPLLQRPSPNQSIAVKVRNVARTRFRAPIEDGPPDVRPPEAFGDVVGIVLLVRPPVVNAVVSAPHQRAVLHRRGQA